MKGKNFLIAAAIYIFCWIVGYIAFLKDESMGFGDIIFAAFFYVIGLVLQIVSIFLIGITERYHYSIFSFLSLLFGATIFVLSIYAMVTIFENVGHIEPPAITAATIGFVVFITQMIIVLRKKKTVN